MKKTLFLTTLLFLFFSCKNNTEPIKIPTKEVSEINKKKECDNETPFGDRTICLPEITGITECYSHPKVKQRANEIDDPGNTTLGYYLDNPTFKEVEVLETVTYDNYYKVYAPNVGKNYKMTTSEMKQIMSLMTSGFIDKTLEDTNQDIKKSGKDVQLSQPVLIEKYELNAKSATLIVIMQVVGTNMEKTMVISMSSVLVKERLIFVAHYLDYSDEKTIVDLKLNTATYIEAFLEANS